MEKIEEYEEAKRFIENDIDKTFDKEFKKTVLRNIWVLGLGIEAGVFGFVHVPELPIFCVALPVIVGAYSLIAYPLIKRRETIKSIKDGSYFIQNSAQEVIEQANRQVLIANKYEEKGRKR